MSFGPIGILLPLSSNYYPSAQQWKSAIEWLASESGEDSYNISLSLHIKDTQNNNLISAITGVIELVEEGVHVVIGEINSEIVEATQQVLNANQIPQIIPLTPSTLLLDSEKYPYIIQSSPSNALQAKAIAELIEWYGWSRCTPIVSMDNYGSDLLKYFKTETTQRGIRLLSTLEVIPQSNISSSLSFVESIKSTRSSVFVLFAQPEDAFNILVTAANNGLVGESYVWIASDSVSYLLSNSTNNNNNNNNNDIINFDNFNNFQGLISVAPSHRDRADDDNENFNLINSQLLSFSGGLASLETVGVTRFYDSIKFLEEAIKSSPSSLSSGSQLLSLLKSFSINGISGTINSTPLGNYDILNFFSGSLVRVGSYFNDSIIFDTLPKFYSGSTTAPSDLPHELRIGYMTTTYIQSLHSLARYALDQVNEMRIINYTLKLIEGFPNRNAGLAVSMATSMATDHDIVAFIGASSSSDSILVSPVLANYEIPAVSFAATSEELSDKSKYPFFMRNIPSDGIQGLSMAHFIHDLGWTSCAMIVSNDLYGVSIMNNFLSVASGLGIRIITQQLFFAGTSVSNHLQAIKDSQAVVIVAMGISADVENIMVEAIRKNMTGVGYQWIFSEAGQSVISSNKTISPYFSGVLATVPTYDPLSASQLRASAAAANQTLYPGLGSSLVASGSVYTYYLYDTVYMIHDAIVQLIQKGTRINNGTALLNQLYNSQFVGVTGLTNIDSKGNRIGMYELNNWNGTHYSRVAIWNPTNGTSFFGNITWMGNGPKPIDVFPSCGYGFYLLRDFGGFECAPCPAGSYNPIIGASSCLQCPSGMFSDIPGQANCQSCPLGYSQNYTGSTSCTICPPGSAASEPQLEQCDLCSLGTYSDTEGSVQCTRCAIGEYASEVGSISCHKCPSGTSTIFMGAMSLLDCGCTSGTYYINETQSCVSCPTGATCSGALDPPVAISGYWAAEDSEVFLKCIDRHACPGGPAGTCATHYSGYLCAHCEDGYTFRYDGCHECNSGVSATFAIVIIFGIIVAVVVVHFIMSDAYVPYSRTLGVGTSIAILITHFQVLGIFGVFDSRWPSPLQEILKVSSLFYIDLDWISLNCFVGRDNFLSSYSVKLLLPVYFAIICILAMGLNRIHKIVIDAGFGSYVRARFPKAAEGKPGGVGWIQKRLVTYLSEYKPITWRILVNCFAAFLDLTYIYLVSTSFEVFQCYSQPDGSHSLVSDASITCFSSDWYRLLPSAIFALLFYGIGVPAVFAVILYKGRNKVHSDKFHITFGYFTQRYRSDCYWWQMVAIVRKFLLSFLIVTFAVTPQTQFTTSLSVMFIAFIAQLHFRPFALKLHNRDESVSLGALLMVLVGGLLLFIPTDDSFRILVGVLILIIILAQIILMCVTIYLLIKTFPQRSNADASPMCTKADIKKVDANEIQSWINNIASEEESQVLTSLLSKVVTYSRNSREHEAIQLNDMGDGTRIITAAVTQDNLSLSSSAS